MTFDRHDALLCMREVDVCILRTPGTNEVSAQEKDIVASLCAADVKFTDDQC